MEVDLIGVEFELVGIYCILDFFVIWILHIGFINTLNMWDSSN